MTVSSRSFAASVPGALAALAVTALLLTPVQAQQIVAPNNLATTEGNSNNRFPLLVNGGMRYQQVYNASQFSTLAGPSLITQIAFRPDAISGGRILANTFQCNVPLVDDCRRRRRPQFHLRQ